MEIGNAVTALRAGWTLKNAAAWKNRTIAVNALTGILTVVVAVLRANGYDLHVTDDVLGAVAGGVWGIVSVFNSWSTAATSAQVGLPSGLTFRPPDGDRPSGG